MRLFKLLVLFMLLNISALSEIYSDNINEEIKAMWIKTGESETYYDIFREGNEILEKSEDSSDLAEVHAIFGFIYYKRQRYDWAEKELKEALRYNRNSKSARWIIAEVYSETDRVKKGVKTLERLSLEYPTDPMILWMLGDIYFENKQEEKAINCYETVWQDTGIRESNPNINLLLRNLINLYVKKKNMEKSSHYIDVLLSYYPNDYATLLLISKFYINLGKNREAIEKLNIIRETFDSEKEVYYLLGGAHYNLEEYYKAKDYLEKALIIDENYSKALELNSELKKIL